MDVKLKLAVSLLPPVTDQTVQWGHCLHLRRAERLILLRRSAVIACFLSHQLFLRIIVPSGSKQNTTSEKIGVPHPKIKVILRTCGDFSGGKTLNIPGQLKWNF